MMMMMMTDLMVRGKAASLGRHSLGAPWQSLTLPQQLEDMVMLLN